VLDYDSGHRWGQGHRGRELGDKNPERTRKKEKKEKVEVRRSSGDDAGLYIDEHADKRPRTALSLERTR
jgi:hypothetical protein